MDERPVGTTYSAVLPALEAGQERAYTLRLRTPGLINGKYIACTVLHELNEYGTSGDLDIITEAFCFSLDAGTDLVWNYNYWGNIQFPELMLK